jgi:hypothetical protein
VGAIGSTTVAFFNKVETESILRDKPSNPKNLNSKIRDERTKKDPIRTK